MLLDAVEDTPRHEYARGDDWTFTERSDGVWLTVVDRDGHQVASFPPGGYKRVESI